MSGPEHYAEAERLLKHADQRMAQDDAQHLRTHENRIRLFAEAQVHATLALAAATAMNPSGFAPDGATAKQWRTQLTQENES